MRYTGTLRQWQDQAAKAERWGLAVRAKIIAGAKAAGKQVIEIQDELIIIDEEKSC